MPRERELGRVLRDPERRKLRTAGHFSGPKAGPHRSASATFAGSAGPKRSARTLASGSKRRGRAVSTGAGRPRALSGSERLSRLPVLNYWFPKQRSNPDACFPGALSVTGSAQLKTFFKFLACNEVWVKRILLLNGIIFYHCFVFIH